MYINEELEKKIINKVFKKKIYNEFVDLLIGGLIGTFIGFILSLIFKSHESTDYQHVNDSYSNPKSFGAVRQSVDDFQQEIPDLKVEQKIKKEVKKNTDEIYEIDTKLASLIKSKIELINKILILIDGKPENTKNVLESFKNGYIGNKTNDRLKLLHENVKNLSKDKRQNYKNLIENLEQILKDQIKFLTLLKELFLEIDFKIPESKVFEKMYNVHFGEKAYEKTKNFANKLNKEDKIYFKVKLDKIAKKDLSFKISSISLVGANDYNLYYDKKINLVIFNDKNDRYFLEDIDEELFLEIFNNNEITFEKKETDEEISFNQIVSDDSDKNYLEDILNDNIEEKIILTDPDFVDLYNSNSKKIKEYIELFNQKKDVFFNFLDEIIKNPKLPIEHTNNIRRIKKDHKDLIEKIDIDSMNDSDLEDIWILDDHATKMNQQFIELKDVYEELLKKLEKNDENVINNKNITKNDLKINEAFDVHFINFFTAEKNNFEKKIKDYNDEETKKEIKQYIKKIDEVINQQITYLKNERKEIIKDDQKTKNYISGLLNYIEKYEESVKGVFDKFDERERKSTDNENSKKEKTLLELTISKIKENKKTGMPISFDLNNKKIKLLDEKSDSEHYIVFLPGEDKVKQFEIYSTKNENILKINSIGDDFILESIEDKYSHKIYEGHYILVKDDNTNEIKIKLQLLINSLFSKLLNSFSDFKEKFEERKNTLKEEIKNHKSEEKIRKINERIKFIDDVILTITTNVYSPKLKNEDIKDLIDNLQDVLESYDNNIKVFFKEIQKKEDKSEIDEKIKKLELKKFSNGEYIVSHSKRIIVLKTFKENITIPFYISTGDGKKKNVPKGKWYPFLGFANNGWFIKGASQKAIFNHFYIPELQNFAKELNETFGDLSTNDKYLKLELKDIIKDCNEFFKEIDVHSDEAIALWMKRFELLHKSFLGGNNKDYKVFMDKILSNDLSDKVLTQRQSAYYYLNYQKDGTFINSYDKSDYSIKFFPVDDYENSTGKFEIYYYQPTMENDDIFNNIKSSIFEESQGYNNLIFIGRYQVDGFNVKILEITPKYKIKEEEKTLLQGVIDTLSVKQKEIRVKGVSYPIKIKNNKISFINEILNEDNEFYIQFNPSDYDMGECIIYSKEDKKIFDDDLLKNPESILFESKSSFEYIIYDGSYEIKDNKIILKMLVYNTQKKDKNNTKDTEDLMSELANGGREKKIIKNINDLEINDNFKNFTQEILSAYYNNFIINKITNPNYKNLIKLDSEHRNNFVKNDKIIYNRNNNKISLGFKFKIETIGEKNDHDIYFFDQDKKDFISYDTKYFIQYDNPSHKFNLIEILRFLNSTSIKKEISSLLDKGDFMKYSILFINNDDINKYILDKIKDDPYIEVKKQEKDIDKKIDSKPSLKNFGFLQEVTTTPNKTSKLELLENIDSPSELNIKLNLDKKVYFYIKNTAKPNEQLFYIEINKNNFKPLLQYLKNNKKFRDIKAIRNNYFTDTFNELAELSNTSFTTMSDDYKIETEDIPVFGVINIEKGEYKKTQTFLPEDIILTSKKVSSDESYFFGESSEKIWIKSYFSNKK